MYSTTTAAPATGASATPAPVTKAVAITPIQSTTAAKDIGTASNGQNGSANTRCHSQETGTPAGSYEKAGDDELIVLSWQGLSQKE